MNPTRFMRDNMKILLVIFVSLLVIVFMLPPEMFNASGGGRGDFVIGLADGEPVHSSDAARAKLWADTTLQLGGLPGDRFPIPFSFPPPNLTGVDLYLLELEAAAAGITFGIEEAKALFAGDPERQVRLRQIKRTQRRSYDDIYADLAKWMAISQLLQTRSDAASPSVASLKDDFRTQTQRASFQFVQITAEDLLQHVPQPSDAELEAFFAQYADVLPSRTLGDVSYGYRQPARVEIEYLTVAPESLLDDMRVRERQAREFYESNAALYSEQRDYSLPTTEAGPPFTETVQLTFAEALDEVRSDLRLSFACNEAERIVNRAAQAASRPWITQDTDDQGFRVQPPIDDLVAFTELQQESLSADYPLVYGRGSGRINELARIEPRLANARITLGGNLPFMQTPQLAFRTKGLYEPNERDQRPVLNLFEPSPVMIQVVNPQEPEVRQIRQAYVFRVVGIEPEFAPASIDEVEGLRAEVIRDWRASKALELAEQVGERLADRAREVGLANAFNEDSELRPLLVDAWPAGQATAPEQLNPVDQERLERLGPHQAMQFTRGQPVLGFIAGRPLFGINELVEPIFAVEPLIRADDPSATPATERVVVGTARRADYQSVFVCEVIAFAPLEDEQFSAQSTNLLVQRARVDQQEFLRHALLDAESIRRRMNWVTVGEPQDGETTEEAAEGEEDLAVATR